MCARINHLARILEEHLPEYRKHFALTNHQFKVINAIKKCRTAGMGGHMMVCEDCGGNRIAYNSCRDRHCPQCQWSARERWMLNRENDLIPGITYFHAVFTLPQEITFLGLYNRRLIQEMLMESSSQTLKIFGKEKFGEGQIGFTQVLHTWGSNLSPHFHVHCIIPGGHISKDGKWTKVKKDYLFPVNAMTVVFRAIFCKKLRAAFRKGKIRFHRSLSHLSPPAEFSNFVKEMFSKKWIVYMKKAFKNAKSVVDYLGLYTHRVAISNQRIKNSSDGIVQFEYRRRRKEGLGKPKVMTLSGVEFLRRYLCHVLPPRMPKIRHYGFLAGAVKAARLETILAQTGAEYTSKAKQIRDIPYADLLRERCGVDILACPYCKAQMKVRMVLGRTGQVIQEEKMAA